MSMWMIALLGCSQDPPPPTQHATVDAVASTEDCETGTVPVEEDTDTGVVEDSRPDSDEVAGEVPADSLDLMAVPSPAMPTVLVVSWKGPAAEVRHTSGDAVHTAAVVDDGEQHTAYLVGHRAHEEVEVWLEGDDFWTRPLTVTTGGLSVEVPVAAVERGAREVLEDGLVLTSWHGQWSSGVGLVDRSGESVWAIPARPGLQLVSAAWTPQGLWTLQEEAGSSSARTTLVRYGFDGTVLDELELVDAHHDLTALDDGGVAWLEQDLRETTEHGLVIGDRIMSFDPVDGVVERFSTWDVLEVERSWTWDSQQALGLADWTHANGLSWSAERGSFLVSLGGLATVLEVDGDDGEVLWSLQGSELADLEAAFGFQHSPSWTPEGTLLLFVNFSAAVENASWAAEFQQAEGGSVTERWNSGRDGPLTEAMGGAVRLPGGDTLIGYAKDGLLVQVDPDGEPQWSLALEDGVLLGEIEVVDPW